MAVCVPQSVILDSSHQSSRVADIEFGRAELVVHPSDSLVLLLFFDTFMTHVSLMQLVFPQLATLFFSCSGGTFPTDELCYASPAVSVSQARRSWPCIASGSATIHWDVVPYLP